MKPHPFSENNTPRNSSRISLTPGIITLGYLAIGVLWIFFSDFILNSLVDDPMLLRQIQLYKGWIYVLLTAGLIFWVLRRNNRLAESARKTIEESRNQYVALLEAASEGIVIADTRGLIKLVNKKVEQLFGYRRSELIGQSVDMLIPKIQQEQHAHYRKAYLEDLKTRSMGQGRHLEGLRKNGSVFPIEVSLSPVVTDEETLIMSFVTDISERKKAEAQAELHQQQLMQADKMATLGILVSGVAHEINNPNNYILLNGKILTKVWNDVMPILDVHHQQSGDFLMAGMPFSRAREKIAQLIYGISEGAMRIQKIVNSLKDFARQDKGDMNQEVAINVVLESAIVIVHNLVKKSTGHFKVNYGDGLPLVRGNIQQIEQVIINLITNACQALENPSQKLTITTRYRRRRNEVLLIVADEGVGIAPENMSRIMDPFFTTRRDTSGTGLGLSISYRIVKDHKGELTYDSRLGEGTTVVLSLPGIKTPKETRILRPV
ncbi:MAG: PAS domain S-box protein [Calditrichaeota bacterium]|nr:PAS domain S-box protein [Calditrichota bacterium]